MSQTVLEEFLSNATSILRDTERHLETLTQMALTYRQPASDPDADDGYDSINGDPTLRLQQIGRQISKLSERSKALQAYLQNGLDAPPADDDEWPRIRILQTLEEERTQLARELENSVGQLLANAVFELASCRRLLSDDAAAVSDGLDALQTELEQGLTDVRQFIAELEPATILGNFGLGAGLRRYLEQYETKTGLKTQFQMNTNFGRLPSIIEIAIFRVIQEALDNTYRHAHASQVEVIIQEKEGKLQFSVTDNGDGLTSDRVDRSRKNLGLARMVDYTELLNGKLRVFSDPGRGTQVVLSIPYPAL